MDEATPTPQPDMGGAGLGELVKALALAQAAIAPPKKGKTASIKSEKGNYTYSYADLADVIECYRKPLSDNGLAIVQTMRPENGHLVLVTRLLHTSGQWIATEYPIKPYDRPQEQGSAITYARRYSVTALLGIAAEDDDDGAAAQRAEPKQEPVSAEAAAILVLAGEIGDLLDALPDQIIKDASAFTAKDGRAVEGFTDPRKVKPGKWLSMTKVNLEKRLHAAKMASEPGADEGAAALA